MKYLEYTETYSDDDVSFAIPPVLPANVRQHVFVTHDESTFYANDYQKNAWIEDSENYCLPKSQGRSIMISEFHCPCHGTMRATVDGVPMISRVIFYPGAGYNGYWTSAHMANQLKDVLVLFSALHKDMTAVFLFDQSSNHKAFSQDALVASRMNLNGHELDKEAIKVRDGYFYRLDINRKKIRQDQNFYVNKEFDYTEYQKLVFNEKLDRQTRADKFHEILKNVHPVSNF